MRRNLARLFAQRGAAGDENPADDSPGEKENPCHAQGAQAMRNRLAAGPPGRQPQNTVTGDTMIRVLVSASSALELARLEALVRSAPSLDLVGSSLRRSTLSQLLAHAQPDVLLER